MRKLFTISILACYLICGCTTVPVKDVSLSDSSVEASTPGPEVEKNAIHVPAPSTPWRDVEEKRVSPPPTKPLSQKEKIMVYEQMMEASLLEENNQFKEAGEIYLKSLALLPQSFFLTQKAGAALLLSGQPEEAVRIARESIQNSTPTPEIHLLLARAYASQNHLEKAIEQYERSLALNPRSIEAMAEVNVLYLRTNKLEKSLAMFRQLQRYDRIQAIFYQFKIALLLLQLNRVDEALVEYRSLAEHYPDIFDVHYHLGTIYEMKNEAAKAIEAYLTALNLNPSVDEEKEVRHRLGVLYTERSSFSEAFYQYSRIKEIDKSDIMARKALVTIHLALGKMNEATDEILELGTLSPASYRIHLLLFEILFKQQREEEAFRHFLDAFHVSIEEKSEPDCQAFLFDVTRPSFLSKASELNLLDIIQTELDSCREQLPFLSRTHFARTAFGLYIQDENQILEGLNLILDVLAQLEGEKEENAINDVCYELLFWYKVRHAFQDRDLFAQVLASLQQCLQHFPENRALNQAVSQLYLDGNQWEKAERQLRKTKNLVVDENEEWKQIVLQLSFVLEKQDKIDQLETVLRDAIARLPEDAQLFNFLGYTFADRNVRLEEALQLIERAIEIDPNDGNIKDSLGWVYYRLGRYEDAIETLSSAADMEKNHPVILDHLGDALLEDGQHQAAIDNWKKSLKYGPDFPSEFTPEFQEGVKQKIKRIESKMLP
jgi:tetratricopeptide (TPR) repeat protein